MVRSSQKENVEFNFHRQFPKFRWLFRDVVLPPVNDSGDEIPITDYVKTQILSEEASSSPQLQGVITALLQLFPSFECYTLPIPATKRDVLKSITRNESKLSTEFNEDVVQLSRSLLNDLEPKKPIASSDQQYLNGPLLSILIAECLESLNATNVIPELRFGWQAAMDSRLETLLNTLVGDYQEQLEEALRGRGAIEESVPANFESPNGTPVESHRDSPKSDSEIQVLETDVPLSPEPASARSRSRKVSERSNVSSLLSPIQVTPPRTLIGIHQSILDSKLREFRREINRCMGAVSKEKKAEFLLRLEERVVVYDKTLDGNCTGRVVGGILLKYIQENYEKSKERCCQTFDHIVEPMKHNLTRAVDGISDAYYTMAVGPAKNEVFALKMNEFTELAGRLAPGSPRNLRVVGQAKDKLKIRWKRPRLHPRAVKEYEVQIMERVKQQRRGEWRTIISSTDKRAAIVTDLMNSTTYLFRVRGRNTNQIGEWSEEIEAATRMGQAGRYGASAVGFVGGSITAPFMLTAETFKEGWQVYRQSETCKEKVQAGVGMVVGGLMSPIIVLSESLLTTSTGVDCAERVYENTGVTEEDDFDESRAEVVSIVPDQSETSTFGSSSGSNSNPNPGSNSSHQNNESLIPSIEPQQQQQQQQQLDNLESERTVIESESTVAAETMQNVVGDGGSCKHYRLSVDRECTPSDDTNAEANANIEETRRKLNLDISGDPSLPRQLSVGSSGDCSLEVSAVVHPVASNSMQYDSPGSGENDSFSIFHSFAFTEQH